MKNGGLKVSIAKVGERETKGKKGRKGTVDHSRLLYHDTAKNRQYAQKRKELGERATAELGVQCWG